MVHAEKGYKMILQDDRTPEQRATHTMIVLATDPGMSGWGLAQGGPSFAGWACKPGYLNACESMVRQRGDMRRVRIVAGDYKPKGGAGHCHIYVWNDSRDRDYERGTK